MKRAEKVKHVFQRCRNARNLTSDGGLTNILVPENPLENPKRCTTWTSIDCPHEMSKRLLERNQAHFGQSQNCTLTSPPTDFTMQFTATCERANAILNNTYLQPQRPPMDESHDTSSESSTAHPSPSTLIPTDDENDTNDPPATSLSTSRDRIFQSWCKHSSIISNTSQPLTPLPQRSLKQSTKEK